MWTLKKWLIHLLFLSCLCFFSTCILHAQAPLIPLSQIKQNSLMILTKLDSNNQKLSETLQHLDSQSKVLKAQLFQSIQELAVVKSSLQKTQDLLNSSQQDFGQYQKDVSAEIGSLKRQRFWLIVGIVVAGGLAVYASAH